ncbi:uncharacterized protein LOC110622468 [Manihot esculenta]|uniref:Uncharacterized protein n=1 Tax=Manihot esculenta TaxID=3983 RepID=A0A2C9V727_MANES|nr:uncharacterized protein LOC110622468 [Manihot esculenta]OAY40357.1 hypothetical protein MANES_09G015800v8 [Manihot esculenta]
MSNWRRHKGEINRQEVQGTTRSNHRKPPHGSWQPTVPSWEKRFCYAVGLVPWRKLLETKKSMYLYENIVQWNDSAVEEAFHNAKNRFWAKINGLHCDISLPDPDIYIDEIDWNSNIDPELYLDLDREPKYPDEKEKGEEVVIFGSSLLLNQPFLCTTGWGEAEEELQKAANAAFDPGFRDCDTKGNNGNPLECNVSQANGAMIDNEWGNCWNDSYGWKNHYEQDNNHNQWNNFSDTTGGDWETWDGSSRRREGAGWYTPRYKTFRGNDYQMDRGWWRNGRGRKKMNFVY